MKRTVLALKPVLAALVLGACSTNPVLPENAWKIAPVQKVRHGGSNAAGHFALGRYREGQGAYEQAIAAYRKALDADPKYAPAWNALGTLQAQLGRFDDGLAALERAVQLQPSASHLHNNLGYALLLAGRAEPAVGSLRRAVELDAGNQRAWRNLAEASRQIGAVEEAAFADARAEGRATTAAHAPAGRPAGGERRDALAGIQVASAPAVSAARPGQVETPPAPVRPETVKTLPAAVRLEAVMSPTFDGRRKTGTPPVLATHAPASGETPRVKIVKIAENVFELRNGRATRADTVAAAAVIVAATTHPVATPTTATVTPIRSSTPETIGAAPVPLAAEPAPASSIEAASPTVSASPAVAALPAVSASPATVASSVMRRSPTGRDSSATPASYAGPAAASPASQVVLGSPAAPASSPAPRSSRPARYEIANGHGGEGLARRLAGLLAAEGFARPRLTNHVPYNQPASYVAYRDGYRDQAEAFAARLPFRPQVLPSPSKGLAADVRLLLGRDLTTSSACAVLALCPAVATKPSAPRSIRVDAV